MTLTMINADYLRRLKERADIVQIIGEFIPLHKAGKQYKACCPFHDEKTPSLTVNPTKQLYKCFGCGKAGDVLDFVQNHKNLTLPEAVQYVAGRLNETVEYEQSNRTPSRFDGIRL